MLSWQMALLGSLVMASPEHPIKATLTSYSQEELLTIEENIVAYTNAERSRYGLPPVVASPDLMEAARRHCAWMASAGSLQHTSAPVFENIAMGQSSSAEAVRDWMNSSGHRANLLNASVRRIGVAAFRSGNGRIFWCQQFLP